MVRKQTYKDFLSDKDFIRWRLTGDGNPASFLESYMSENEELKSEFEQAVGEFSKIRLNKELLPETDVKLLWQQIRESVEQKKNGSVTVNYIDNDKEQQIVTEKETINKLVVPYGKRSTLELSDGTKVWVNSGSVLEFPSKFEGKTRTVRLAGEIYLEVAEDKQHPFIVNTSEMDITVYGTAFNVSAYEDRNQSFVALVEGKGSVKSTITGEVAVMDSQEMVFIENNCFNKISTDIRKYTSWKDGYLLVNQTPITEALKQLEHYYNLSFNINENIDFRKITCTGKIYLFNDLDDTMKTISLLSPIKYKREDKKIYIEY